MLSVAHAGRHAGAFFIPYHLSHFKFFALKRTQLVPKIIETLLEGVTFREELVQLSIDDCVLDLEIFNSDILVTRQEFRCQ